VPELKKKLFHYFIEVLSQVCSRPLPVIDIFPIIPPIFQRYGKSQFQCSITSLLLVLEQKIVLPGYRKSYPMNLGIYPCLTFDLYLMSNQGHNTYFRLKMSITYIYIPYILVYRSHQWIGRTLDYYIKNRYFYVDPWIGRTKITTVQ
jgi:hypothetical protein